MQRRLKSQSHSFDLFVVQRVYAVGKPPDDMVCSFRNLKNVVVLPSVGTFIHLRRSFRSF